MSELRIVQPKKRKGLKERVVAFLDAEIKPTSKTLKEEKIYEEPKKAEGYKASLSDGVYDTFKDSKNIQKDIAEVEPPKKAMSYPQFLEYDAPSDEELLELAKKSVESKKEAEIESLTNSNANTQKSLYKAINDQIESAEAKKKNQIDNYNSALKEIENQVLKRGIQRSSIAVNTIGGLEKYNVEALAKIDSDKAKEIDALNKEIALLESDFAEKLSKINQKYADAIKAKLAELKEDRDNKLQSIIKYNNSLALNGYGGINGGFVDSDENGVIQSPVISTADLRKVSEVVTNFMQYDDPNKALTDFLSDDSYREYLGDYYTNVYTILYNRAKAAAGNKN